MSNALSTSERNALLLDCKRKLDAVRADIALVDSDMKAGSPEFLNELVKQLQGVKGSANSLGLFALKHLSQMLESLLVDVQQGQLTLAQAHTPAVLSALDRMAQIIGGLEPLANAQYDQELKGLIGVLSPRRKTQLFRAPHSRRLRVLLGEDDFVSLELLQGMLSKYGDCDSVGNGREAVEIFAAARLGGLSYDLVCLDVRMPETEGPQALQEIRQIEKDDRVPSGLARVFMTTSVGDMETVAGSIKLKCDAYLLKPINLKRLEERLQFFGLIPRERWLAPP